MVTPWLFIPTCQISNLSYNLTYVTILEQVQPYDLTNTYDWTNSALAPLTNSDGHCVCSWQNNLLISFTNERVLMRSTTCHTFIVPEWICLFWLEVGLKNLWNFKLLSGEGGGSGEGEGGDKERGLGWQRGDGDGGGWRCCWRVEGEGRWTGRGMKGGGRYM